MDIVREFVDLDIKYKKKGQASSDGKDEDKAFIYATEFCHMDFYTLSFQIQLEKEMALEFCAVGGISH